MYRMSSHLSSAYATDLKKPDLGAPPVEPDRPRVDRVDPEMGLAPRIARERRADLVLGFGLDDMHDAVLVGERAAQDDEPLVHKSVHEGCVHRPVGLLLERPRRVPLRARAQEYDVEHRHARLLPDEASCSPGAGRQDERCCWQPFAAEGAQPSLSLLVEIRRVAAGRADPERERLPPLLEARMLNVD